MILVIVLGSGSGDLDKIQSSVTEFFRDIPKGISPYTPEISRPWDSGKTYFLQSVENNQRVMITWRIPWESHQQNKAAKYVMQLFSEEREGSLSFFLKEKGWIWSLEVYTGGKNGFSADDEDPSAYSSTSFGQLFILVLELTNEGLEQEYVLINHVYEYLGFLSLNTPPPYLMKEQKDLQDMRFRFLHSDGRLIDSLLGFADRLSANMLWCDADHALSQCFSNPTCDHSEIDFFLKEHFTPANMRIYWLVKTLPEKEICQDEPWFGTSYMEKEIPKSCIKDWVGLRNFFSKGSRFSFPSENLFMPSNENLLGSDDEELRPSNENLLGSDDEELHPSNENLLGSDDEELHEGVEMEMYDEELHPSNENLLVSDDEELHEGVEMELHDSSEDGDSDGIDNTIKITKNIFYVSGNSSIGLNITRPNKFFCEGILKTGRISDIPGSIFTHPSPKCCKNTSIDNQKPLICNILNVWVKY